MTGLVGCFTGWGAIERERSKMKTGSILQGIKGALQQKYGGREGYYRLFPSVCLAFMRNFYCE